MQFYRSTKRYGSAFSVGCRLSGHPLGQSMRHRDQSICQRRQRAGSRARMALVWAAVTGTVLRLALGPASASTEVEGQRENVKLRTENASIREVLDALSATFKLTYKLAPNVLRNLTGLYS